MCGPGPVAASSMRLCHAWHRYATELEKVKNRGQCRRGQACSAVVTPPQEDSTKMSACDGHVAYEIYVHTGLEHVSDPRHGGWKEAKFVLEGQGAENLDGTATVRNIQLALHLQPRNST